MSYKVKGVSKKTGEGTVYIIYRNGAQESVKSTGVTVKPAYFNLTTGKVSAKDKQHPEKNQQIQSASAAFERACRDVESHGHGVTRATVDAALESYAEHKRTFAAHTNKSWGLLEERENEIEELENLLAQKRSVVSGHRFTLEFGTMTKQEWTTLMIEREKERLAALETESAAVRSTIEELQQSIGMVSSCLFRDKLTEYINNLRLNNVKDSSLKTYEIHGTAVTRFNKNLKLSDINLQFLQEFQQHLVGRGVTNNSIRAIIGKLKAVYKCFAEDEGLPVGFLSKFKLVKAAKDENVLFLTPQELAALEDLPLKSRGQIEVRRQFLFAVETGLRRSDYNLSAANIQGNEIVLATKKTNTQLTVPLTDKARQLFAEAGMSFRFISESQFNQTLRAICKKIPLMGETSVKTVTVGTKVIQTGLPKWQRMSSHVGRKTFVENAVAKGIELIAIAEWLGHSDTTMLEQYYANKKQIAKREAVKLLN